MLETRFKCPKKFHTRKFFDILLPIYTPCNWSELICSFSYFHGKCYVLYAIRLAHGSKLTIEHYQKTKTETLRRNKSTREHIHGKIHGHWSVQSYGNFARECKNNFICFFFINHYRQHLRQFVWNFHLLFFFVLFYYFCVVVCSYWHCCANRSVLRMEIINHFDSDRKMKTVFPLMIKFTTAEGGLKRS